MSKSKRKLSPGATLVFIIIALVAFLYGKLGEPEAVIYDGDFFISVLDVGQGDSILISCGDSKMLVDCGEAEYADRVINAVNACPGELLYVVATHPHSDHIGAMAKVLEKCPPKLLLMPEKENTTSCFTKMLDMMEKKNIPGEFVYAGDEYTLGDAIITVVSPEKGYTGDELNSWSAVLLIEYNGFSFLLTGDSTKDRESEYLKYIDSPVDVLKVAHHGSSGSNGKKLLKEITPTYAIISCGEGNSYGHPHKEVRELLQKYAEKIYRTDKNGTVTVLVKGDELYVSAER